MGNSGPDDIEVVTLLVLARRALRHSPPTTLVFHCGAVVLTVLAAGCGSTTTAPTPPGPRSTTSLATSPTAPVTSALPTSTSPSTTLAPPTPTTAPSPVVAASGSLLQPPAQPLTIPAESNCHLLLTLPANIAGISACATANGQSGTITAIDEGYAHTQEWDVWRRAGTSAVLALSYVGNIQSTPGFVFHEADLTGDGDQKLLAVEHTPQIYAVSALDVIEGSGQVVAHIAVGANGVVGPAPGGGVETWSHANGATSATSTIIRYDNGSWRTVSATTVALNQVPVYPDDDGFGGGLP